MCMYVFVHSYNSYTSFQVHIYIKKESCKIIIILIYLHVDNVKGKNLFKSDCNREANINIYGAMLQHI